MTGSAASKALKFAAMFGSDRLIVNRERRVWLTGAQTVSHLLAATLFPPRCCLCEFEGSFPDLDLCGVCRADLPWRVADEPGIFTALDFAEPADGLVRQLKYQGVLSNARVLGMLLVQAVVERGAPLPHLLVPVPLHVARLRERGFNQAAAIARYAGRMLGIESPRHLVRRVRNTPSQTSLDMGERHRNVRGAFAICGPRALARLRAARHVAIVDDVITTGSTAGELRAVLVDAGVSRVDSWAVARALQARETPVTAR